LKISMRSGPVPSYPKFNASFAGFGYMLIPFVTASPARTQYAGSMLIPDLPAI